jgi:hypothetical protein
MLPGPQPVSAHLFRLCCFARHEGHRRIEPQGFAEDIARERQPLDVGKFDRPVRGDVHGLLCGPLLDVGRIGQQIE